MDKWSYIRAVAKRGDAYGGGGGTLDLLQWCDKLNTNLVTEDEARQFFMNPSAPYCPSNTNAECEWHDSGQQ